MLKLDKTDDALTLTHQLVTTFLDVKPHEAIAIALWVLHSHTFTQFNITPRLMLMSPVPQCGKTTVLRLLELLTKNPERLDGASPALIYRLIETAPTMLIDEGDNLGLMNNGPLRAILNSGHAAGGGIGRVIADQPYKFSTFAPMAVAAIGVLPLPIMQRSVVVNMHRTYKRIARLPENDTTKDAQSIAYVRSRIEEWAAAVRLKVPTLPAALVNRPADNWRPLISIADTFGDDPLGGESWGARARAAALVFARSYLSEDAGVVLLDDVRAIFADRDRMTSDALLAALLTLERGGISWSEWRGVRDDQAPRKLSAGELSRLLRPFQIRPGSIRLKGSATTQKGYMREQFESAWSRYCPKPGTVQQCNIARPGMGLRSSSVDKGLPGFEYDFPVPPWAVRALMQRVLPPPGKDETALAPSAGHIAGTLRESFASVTEYDGDFLRSFDIGAGSVDWIIAAPLFPLADAVAHEGLRVARRGVAVFARTNIVAGAHRFETLYKVTPPSLIAQFVERVPIVQGRLDPKANSATSFAWLIWDKAHPDPMAGQRYPNSLVQVPVQWIPPCRKALERPEDYPAAPTLPEAAHRHKAG